MNADLNIDIDLYEKNRVKESSYKYIKPFIYIRNSLNYKF